MTMILPIMLALPKSIYHLPLNLIALLNIFRWYQTHPIGYLDLRSAFPHFRARSVADLESFQQGWWSMARSRQVKMGMMTYEWVTNSYVALFSTSSGSSLVESVINTHKGCYFRGMLKKHQRSMLTTYCFKFKIIFRDRSTSRADSSSFASSVSLLVDATTRPRSSNVPISLY